jgi:hypothetical protein
MTEEAGSLYGAPDATYSAGHKDWRQATTGELYTELIELQGILAEYKRVIDLHHADFLKIKEIVTDALSDHLLHGVAWDALKAIDRIVR